MMQMEFTYQDFLENYATDNSWLPERPLRPWEVIEQSKFPEDEAAIGKKHDRTIDALIKRMGEAYFEKFKRAKTLSLGYGGKMFPAYQLLFHDIACEDWLSLVDFHKGFGRDHSVHQPLTAYIVCKLLGRGRPNDAFHIRGNSLLDMALDTIMSVPDSQYLLDRLKHYDALSPLLQGNRELWRQVFYQTTIVTAMYHDLGYPWQFIEKMHETLKDDILLCGRLAYADPQRDPKANSIINPVVDNYIARHQDELMFRPFYNYGKGGLTTASINKKVFETNLHTSHGVPGALAYWAYNDAFITSTNATTGLIKFCQEWSCMAILMHDMQKAYTQVDSGFARLDFNTDPLSFIIALADTLEDFNRPNASFKPDKDNPNGCKIEYSFPSLAVELVENNGVAEIRYVVEKKETASQRKFKSEDQVKLFNPGGYFDLNSIGLKSLTINCID